MLQKEVVSLIRIFAILVAIVYSFQIIAILPVLPTTILVGVPFLFSCILLLTGDVKFNIPYVVFIVYCFLCLLILRPDPVFRSYSRLLSFAMLLFALTPMIKNNCLDLFREELLKYITVVIVAISFLSFFCYFLGINYFSTEYSDGFIHDFQGGGGHFSGLFRHSMILGPMSGISTCYCVSKNLKNWDWKYLMLAFVCMGACLLSGSRGAILATLFGVLTSLIKVDTNPVIKRRILTVVLLLLVSFPLWNGLLGEIESKMSHADREDMGYFDSRTIKFHYRWMEIKESPLIGMGFATIDPDNGDEYDPDTGVVEPGSSWLGLISMTGIIGLVIFIMMVIGPITNVVNRHGIGDVFMVSCFILFSVHMIIEGYLLASGSVLAFFLWLLFGVAAGSYKNAVV